MKYTADLNELKDFALKMKDKGVKGKIFVNQANYNLEEPILSDENTAGRQPLQIFRIVFQTGQESAYYEYLFNEATDLEEINLQLEEVYTYFEKENVSVELYEQIGAIRSYFYDVPKTHGSNSSCVFSLAI